METEKTQEQQEQAQTTAQSVIEQVVALTELQSLKAAARTLKRYPWAANMDEKDLMALEARANKLGASIVGGDFEILGGRFWPTVQFRLRKADETGQFDGFDKDEPLPKSEWAAWGVRADALHAWYCIIKRKDHKNPYMEVGFGGGSRDQESNKGAGQPVAKQFPRELASKRARSRTLALAFPLGGLEAGIDAGFDVESDLNAVNEIERNKNPLSCLPSRKVTPKTPEGAKAQENGNVAAPEPPPAPAPADSPALARLRSIALQRGMSGSEFADHVKLNTDQGQIYFDDLERIVNEWEPAEEGAAI